MKIINGILGPGNCYCEDIVEATQLRASTLSPPQLLGMSSVHCLDIVTG